MNSFSEYMDQIKAGPELKKRTEAYVLNEMQKRGAYPEPVSMHKNTRSEKFFIRAVSAAACLLVLLGCYAFYNMPVNYLCIDINPSVELGINIFEKVVNAEAYNEDGSHLLGKDALNIKYMQINEAVGVIVSEAAEQGYIAGDGSTVIALTAESKRDDTALKLSGKCEDGLNALLNNESISAVVYTDCSGIEFRKEAKEAGVSPGKYKLITILNSLDPNITIDVCKNAKITDIITRVDETALQSEQSGQPGAKTAALEKIKAAARKVKQIRDNKNSEENKNQSSDSSEKEMIQNQEDNKSNQGSDNSKKQEDSAEDDTAGNQRKDESAGKDKSKDKDSGNKGTAGSDKHEGKGKGSSSGNKAGQEGKNK